MCSGRDQTLGRARYSPEAGPPRPPQIVPGRLLCCAARDARSARALRARGAALLVSLRDPEPLAGPSPDEVTKEKAPSPPQEGDGDAPPLPVMELAFAEGGAPREATARAFLRAAAGPPQGRCGAVALHSPCALGRTGERPRREGLASGWRSQLDRWKLPVA